MDAVTTEDYVKAVEEAAKFIRDTLGSAEVAITLGSGLGGVTESLTDVKSCDFSEVPHFPRLTVPGHAARVITGYIGKRRVLCYSGRVHGYEGVPFYMLAFALRVAKAVGCRLYVCTNAAGGSLKGMTQNCVTILTDMINFTRNSYLCDVAFDARLGPTHPDMSNVFKASTAFHSLIVELARKHEVAIFDGVYGGTPGPVFETPAEVAGFTAMGAGVFGMSTVAEAAAAASVGLPVVGLSLVSNLAAGCDVVGTQLSHTEVMESGMLAMRRFRPFVESVISAAPLELLEQQTDATATDVHAPNAPIQLKYPRPLPPTAATAQWVAANLRALLPPGTAAPSAALLLLDVAAPAVLSQSGSGHPMREILGVAAQSVSARDGSVYLYSPAGSDVTPLWVVVCGGLLGRNEGALLGAGLRLAGVAAVAAVVPATPTDPTRSALAEQTVVAVSSALTSPLHVPRHLVPELCVPTAEQFHFLGAINTQSEAALFAVAGPEPPTPAETRMASKFGCTLATSACISPMFALHDSGAATALFALQLPSLTYPHPIALPDPDFFALAESIAKAGAETAPKLATPPAAAASTASPLPPQLRDPVVPSQVPVATARASAEKLRDLLSLSKSPPHQPVGIVVREELKSAVEGLLLNSRGVSAADALFPERHGRAGTSYILTGIMNGTEVIVLVGGSEVRDSDELASDTFGLRVLGLLGVWCFVLIGTAVPVDDRIQPGNIVTIKDHINFYGRSPLTGRNQDEWGVRFVDMSAVYAPALRSLAESEVGATEAVAVLLPTCLTNSERQAAKALGGSVVVSSLVPETHVIRHMERACTAVCITTQTLESEHIDSDCAAAVSALLPKLVAAAGAVGASAEQRHKEPQEKLVTQTLAAASVAPQAPPA